MGLKLISQSWVFRMFFVGLVSTSAFAAQDDSFFIQRRSLFDASGKSIDPSTLRPPVVVGTQVPPRQLGPTYRYADALVKIGPDGHSEVVLTDGLLDVRSFRVTSDGSTVVCLRSNKDETQCEVQIISTTGTVRNTIDLASQKLHVFGSPVLLPDKKHIGLTIYQPLPAAAPAADTSVAGGRGRGRGRGRGGQQQNRGGQVAATNVNPHPNYPMNPEIVVMDLDGKDLQKIGPGMLPDWSPNGKKILYTKMDGVGGPFVLWEMNQKGGGDLPTGIAQQKVCEGVFAPDGKDVAYIAVTDGTAGVWIERLGSGMPRPITGTTKGDLRQFESVRWLPDGKTLEIVQLLDATGHTDKPVGTASDSASVWRVGSDGKGLRQISPSSASAVIDLDADRMLSSLITQGATEERKAPFDPVAWDPKKPIEYSGTYVYTQDEQGKRIPVPDGRYILPNGSHLIVSGGRKQIVSN